MARRVLLLVLLCLVVVVHSQQRKFTASKRRSGGPPPLSAAAPRQNSARPRHGSGRPASSARPRHGSGRPASSARSSVRPGARTATNTPGRPRGRPTFGGNPGLARTLGRTQNVPGGSSSSSRGGPQRRLGLLPTRSAVGNLQANLISGSSRSTRTRSQGKPAVPASGFSRGRFRSTSASSSSKPTRVQGSAASRRNARRNRGGSQNNFGRAQQNAATIGNGQRNRGTSPKSFGRRQGNVATIGKAQRNRGGSQRSFGRRQDNVATIRNAQRNRGGTQKNVGRGHSNAAARGSFQNNRRGSQRTVGQSSSSSARRRGSQRALSRGQDNTIGTPKRVVTQAPNIDFNCPEPDGFFPNEKQCDKYFQCKEGVASVKLCPDGLLFHPNRTYPCVYPVETNCTASSTRQEPRATEGCPRQFATFKDTHDERNCGAYTKCIAGVVFDSACPESLAFDERTLNCEWADLVEGCNPTDYLSHECEQRQFADDQVGQFTREPHPDNCTSYYLCLNKEDGSVQPRLQGCPDGFVFDREKGECSDNLDEVVGCADAVNKDVVAALRQRQQDEKERQEERLAQLKARLLG